MKMSRPQKRLYPTSTFKKVKKTQLIAHGNNSDGWDQEDGRVRHDLTAQAKADDALDNAVFPVALMNQVNA
jgi:hypothetical protein